jgi:AraC-like DNA-binding protein
MPIYMDRHDIPEEITAEHVAQMHQEDLKVQHLFDCKGMTYWCDEHRKTAFCLIEAPNKAAIQKMHNHAHGDFPHRIIEVNKNIVESFLGRIEDPEKSQNTKLNIINDPAFRVLMRVETSDYLHRLEANPFSVFTQKFHNSITKSFKQFEGNIVKQDTNSYMVSFKSVSNAIVCALKIQYNFKDMTPKTDASTRKLKIGVSAGAPVTHKSEFFEDTLTLAKRLCEIVSDQLVITSDVRSLYESENRNKFINKEQIRTLNPEEEKFLTDVMDFVETIWNTPDFNVNDFSKKLGFSKSQLNRKLKNLTGKSPNNFIVEFKLQQALKLLQEQKGNISEIAYETGFNSAAYFSTCFKNKFGILPSLYIQNHMS